MACRGWRLKIAPEIGHAFHCYRNSTWANCPPINIGNGCQNIILWPQFIPYTADCCAALASSLRAPPAAFKTGRMLSNRDKKGDHVSSNAHGSRTGSSRSSGKDEAL